MTAYATVEDAVNVMKEGAVDYLTKPVDLPELLDRLTPEHREVVKLTFFHGFSYQEVAEVAKCPVNTVKTRMFYAKKQFQDALGKLGLQGD